MSKAVVGEFLQFNVAFLLLCGEVSSRIREMHNASEQSRVNGRHFLAADDKRAGKERIDNLFGRRVGLSLTLSAPNTLDKLNHAHRHIVLILVEYFNGISHPRKHLVKRRHGSVVNFRWFGNRVEKSH